MRILFIIDGSPWNAQYGGAMRLAGIIKEVAKYNQVGVVLVSRSPETVQAFHRDDPGETENFVINGLDQNRAEVRDAFLSLVTKWKADVVWFFSHAIFRSLGSFSPVFTLLDFADVRWRKILREAAVTTVTRRIKLYLKALYSRVEENAFIGRVDAATVCSKDESRLFPDDRKVIVLENGMEFPETMPARQRGGSKKILMMGHLFHHPNYDGLVWFTQNVWPHLKKQMPEAEVVVIGKQDGQSGDIASVEGIHILGYVESTESYIDEAALLAVPLRIAGGTRLKILTAWSQGLPVVSTSIGAEGLGAVDGKHLLLRDTGAAFAEACVDVLRDPSLGKRLAFEGYEHGRNLLAWPVIGARFNQVLAERVHNKRPAKRG